MKLNFQEKLGPTGISIPDPNNSGVTIGQFFPEPVSTITLPYFVNKDVNWSDYRKILTIYSTLWILNPQASLNQIFNFLFRYRKVYYIDSDDRDFFQNLIVEECFEFNPETGKKGPSERLLKKYVFSKRIQFYFDIDLLKDMYPNTIITPKGKQMLEYRYIILQVERGNQNQFKKITTRKKIIRCLEVLIKYNEITKTYENSWVTVNDICDETGFNRDCIKEHLEELGVELKDYCKTEIRYLQVYDYFMKRNNHCKCRDCFKEYMVNYAKIGTWKVICGYVKKHGHTKFEKNHKIIKDEPRNPKNVIVKNHRIIDNKRVEKELDKLEKDYEIIDKKNHIKAAERFWIDEPIKEDKIDLDELLKELEPKTYQCVIEETPEIEDFRKIEIKEEEYDYGEEM